jgi:hypothetical protein
MKKREKIMNLNIVILLTIILNFSHAQKNIMIIPPQSSFDASHNYFYTLLEKSLKKNTSVTNILFSKKMEQGRALIELKENRNINVYWAGTSIKREKELRAIKIPLLKGLLGYRVFIINKKDKKLFNKISKIDELKKLKACQGADWPDSEILINSNFNVLKNTNYEAMFLQLTSKRCDYFPRGIHEAHSEVEARKASYERIMLYDKIIIYYPFPMYFFVSKDNEELAIEIEKGLLKMIEDGSFDNHLKQSIITKHLYPMNKWQNNKIFKISNPLLSKETNTKDEKFWIVPK